jgi:type IV pilus assembly protein PilP
MRRRVAWLIVLTGVATASAALAQTPAKPAPPATQAAQPAAKPAQPTPTPTQPATAPAQPPAAPPTEAYTYNPEGRRDPFISMLLRGIDLRGGPMTRPEGVRGLLISEVTVKGIVKSSRGFIAMLLSPDNKTYIVHSNDRLFDGTIKAITVDAVVFSQEVNDPLSLVKQREVRKPLRALQEGK